MGIENPRMRILNTLSERSEPFSLGFRGGGFGRLLAFEHHLDFLVEHPHQFFGDRQSREFVGELSGLENLETFGEQGIVGEPSF